MGKLISIHLLEDRLIVILFTIIKLGIIRNKKDGFSGFSLVIGLFNIELQINLSKYKKVKLNGYGRA